MYVFIACFQLFTLREQQAKSRHSSGELNKTSSTDNGQDVEIKDHPKVGGAMHALTAFLPSVSLGLEKKNVCFL